MTSNDVSKGQADDETRYMVAGSGAPDVDAVHPDRWEYRPGVDYVRGWREATTALTAVRDALGRAGLGGGVLGMRAGVLADGTGYGEITLTVGAARRLSELLEALRERQEAAPHIRGPDAADPRSSAGLAGQAEHEGTRRGTRRSVGTA